MPKLQKRPITATISRVQGAQVWPTYHFMLYKESALATTLVKAFVDPPLSQRSRLWARCVHGP